MINGKSLEHLLADWKSHEREELHIKEMAKKILISVEDILAFDNGVSFDPGLWHEYLDISGKTDYLLALQDREERYRWAETAFKAIRVSNYSLKTMFDQRVSGTPQRTLFRDITGTMASQWNYRQIDRHVMEIAAVFYSVVQGEPRVAIFSENCPEGARTDLACLFYDILVTPLNVHFNQKVLVDIFNHLEINIVVTDTDARLKLLEQIRPQVHTPFVIFVSEPGILTGDKGTKFLGEACKRLNAIEIKKILEGRKKRDLTEVATIMYTSGSTGDAKGVSFSLYHLVSKRFARAAALPKVGNNEVLLCYLPLYHTFGRFLEMLGTIYWNGTYVFTGNPTAETLLSLFPKINPTGFISIPLRWMQLQENCLEKMKQIPGKENKYLGFREVVGSNLRWGLSAAGYLDPKVFRFFQVNGVDLCSGFGMTEATGGITMNPPGEYTDNSVGIPLPGIKAQFTRKKELKISGHYIAHYLSEKGPGDRIPFPGSPGPGEKTYWLHTGDLFRILPGGHFELIDRIKDIYKNNKGQTIAPRVVEKKFEGVPGIKRTFLVGDRRDYNVLFIVPDKEDSFLLTLKTSEKEPDYFHRLIIAANQGLAPYERVINFLVLDRDFYIDKKELTPKGSFNRKIILINFTGQIEPLYQQNSIQLDWQQWMIKIPRWFYRDQGIMEDDIFVSGEGLANRISGGLLPLENGTPPGTVLIGDLEYMVSGNVIDLGIFTRQPRLWVGNPSLIRFCPVKEGWDLGLDGISSRVLRPLTAARLYSESDIPGPVQMRDYQLVGLNRLVCYALFVPKNTAIDSIKKLGVLLKEVEDRKVDLIRCRLEALAYHPEEEVRCLAFKILLEDEPGRDYSQAFPGFISSGLTFLNRETIESIAFSRMGVRQLEALRKRLYDYRMQLNWPINEVSRHQFEKILELLSRFVHYHPAFYNAVRSELANWILFRHDPELAAAAEKIFMELYRDYEVKLAEETPSIPGSVWDRLLIFDDGLSPPEILQIKNVLTGSNFLKDSIMLAFEEKAFKLEDVPEGGIWVSGLPGSQQVMRCRISVHTNVGKHFNLQLVFREEKEKTCFFKSLYWCIAIAGHPYGVPVLPVIGNFLPESRVISTVYPDELTVWEKIRQFSSIYTAGYPYQKPWTWRKLFIQALSVFWQAWQTSECQVVPGAISPENVVVPELDFHEGVKISFLTTWDEYESPLSLVRPIIKNFYRKPLSHYPWCRKYLDCTWIFDACCEALGKEKAMDFLTRLKSQLVTGEIIDWEIDDFAGLLANYIDEMQHKYYVPLPVYNAVERYKNWENLNPRARPPAKEQTITALFTLYRLHRFPEIARYYFYRFTYFAGAGEEVLKAYDRLISAMSQDPGKPAIQLIELSDLQAVLTGADDRDIFTRLVFPQIRDKQQVDVGKTGEKKDKRVTVSSLLTDKQGEIYIFREPVDPKEIGQLHRIFFQEGYPLTVSEQDRYFIAIDTREKIIGGIAYKFLENNVVQLEGMVVTSSLKNQGIGTAMLEDFCNHMVSLNVSLMKAYFYLPQYFINRGFKVDERWGSLIKILSTREPARARGSEAEIVIFPR
jgi:long-chain acyl-CoA synthetase